MIEKPKLSSKTISVLVALIVAVVLAVAAAQGWDPDPVLVEDVVEAVVVETAEALEVVEPEPTAPVVEGPHEEPAD